MSLKFEQLRSLHETRRLLFDICSRRVPASPELVERAHYCARHFPFLKETGEPMFSRDDFPCPTLDDGYLGYEMP